MSHGAVLSTVLLLLGIFGVSVAINCYNCAPSSTNDCSDLKNVTTVTCEPLKDAFPPVCIRIATKSELGNNITLLCTSKQSGNECDPPSVHQNITDCKICQTDLCNSQENLFPFSSLLLVLTVTTIFFS